MNASPKMTENDRSNVGGVDGCSAGWLRATRGGEGSVRANVFSSVDELLNASRTFFVLTVDIPIGLTENSPRECDVAARSLLGPRASSVFPAPVRASLEGTSYREACDLSERACGKRLSQQAFAILPRIRDMDRALRADPSLQAIVREDHPEVCFTVWNGNEPLSHPKRTFQGLTLRKHLTDAHFGPAFDSIRSSLPRSVAADDDILDALAALWTAERVLAGQSMTIPGNPPRDSLGLVMEMVA